MDVLAGVSRQYCQCGTGTLVCQVANTLLLFRTIQMYLLIYYTATAEFGGSVSALQCMCSVDRFSHYTVVTLCDQFSFIRETNNVCPRSVLCPDDPVANGEELGMMIGVLNDKR